VPIITKSAYTAELAAIGYVCHSLSDKECNVVVHTSVPHIAKLFKKKDDGKWSRVRNKNSDFIEEIRNLTSDFKSFTCDVVDKKDDAMKHVRELARKPVRS
jgi:hypothetical protein